MGVQGAAGMDVFLRVGAMVVVVVVGRGGVVCGGEDVVASTENVRREKSWEMAERRGCAPAAASRCVEANAGIPIWLALIPTFPN